MRDVAGTNALEELIETCTTRKRAQFQLKLVSALGLIATGLFSGMVAISVDVGTCEPHQRGIFGAGHRSVFQTSDRGQLILSYLVTVAFIVLFIFALVVGRVYAEKRGYDMQGRAWSELNPYHPAHFEAHSTRREIIMGIAGVSKTRYTSRSHVVPVDHESPPAV